MILLTRVAAVCSWDEKKPRPYRVTPAKIAGNWNETGSPTGQGGGSGRVCLRRHPSLPDGNSSGDQRGFFPVTTGLSLYDTHSVNDPS